MRTALSATWSGRAAATLRRLLLLGAAVATLASLPGASGCAITTDVIEYAPDPPPAYRVEVRPLRPGPRHVWQPGHWRWNPGPRRYVWAPGRWKPLRHPHHHAWVPGEWRQSGRGWQWVRGHWR